MQLKRINKEFFKKSIYSNVLAQWFGKLLSVILSLVLTAKLTQYLEPNIYGIYVFIISFLTSFSLLSDFGLNLTVIRELLSIKKHAKELTNTYFVVRLVLTAITLITPVVIVFIFPYESIIRIGMIITSFGIAVSNFGGFFNTLLQSRKQLYFISIIDILSRIITFLLSIICIVLNLNVLFLLSAIGIGNLIAFLYAIKVTNYHFSFTLFSKVQIKQIKSLLRKSLMVGLTLLLSALYFKIDTFMLSLYRSTNELGYYGLSYKIFENLMMLWGYFMATIYPVLSDTSIRYQKKNSQVLSLAIMAGSIGGVLISLSLLILSPLIIRLLSGPLYINSIISLQILGFAFPFWCLNNLWFYMLVVNHREHALIKILFFAVLINIVLNLFFIPQYGYIGASIVTVITEIVLFLVYLFVIKTSQVKFGISINALSK